MSNIFSHEHVYDQTFNYILKNINEKFILRRIV